LQRLLFYASLLFAAGAAWPPLLPWQLSTLPLLLLSFFCLSLSWFYRNSQNIFASLFLSLALFFSGACAASADLERHPNRVRPWLGRELQLQGIVAETPVRQGSLWVFPLDVEQPFQDRVWVKMKKMVKMRTGDHIQMEGIVQAPAEPRNPGGFDEEEYLRRKGIHAVFWAEREDGVHLLPGTEKEGERFLESARERVEHVFSSVFPQAEADFLGGLLFGWSDSLDSQTEEAFALLGITHILAASGMNVALIVMPVWWGLARWGIRPGIRLTLVLPLLLLYAGLAGFTPSVVRAALMTGLWLVGQALDRKVDGLTLVGVSAWLSILADPLILWDLGFQLSYAVTIGLIVLTPRLTSFFSFLPVPVKNGLAATLAAEVVSVPLLLYTFHVYTPLSLFANLYVAPLVTLLVPLGMFVMLVGLVSLPAAAWLVPPVHALFFLLLKPVMFLGEKRWFMTSFASPSPIFLFFYYGGTGLLISRWKARVYRLLACLMIGGYLIALWQPVSFSHELTVTFLDVGQGDSIFIRTPSGRTLLVDGGGRSQRGDRKYDAGEKIVVPFLRQEGVKQIDLVISTHPDEDHLGGLFSVIGNIPVKGVLISGFPDPSESYREFLALVREKQIPLYRAKKGDRWEVDQGIFLRMLNPPSPYVTGTRRDVNANCIVFELDYEKRSFLFTGDVEGEVEPLLQASLHPVDVLKVAHHGSKYSTSASFLQTVHPRYAVISVGRNNSYGHPDAELLKRLKEEGARILRTDESGAIIVHTDGEQMTVEEMKGMHNRLFSVNPRNQKEDLQCTKRLSNSLSI
jgi:competence protein ComEC